MSGVRLTDIALPVYCLKPGDHEAGVDLDSFSLAKYHRATIFLLPAVLTGDAVLKFYAGATVGAKTTAIVFTYRLAGGEQAAASSDILGARSVAVAPRVWVPSARARVSQVAVAVAAGAGKAGVTVAVSVWPSIVMVREASALPLSDASAWSGTKPRT